MNQKYRVIRNLIVSEHALTCPSCNESVFVARATNSEVPHGGYWLGDGDTIAGVYQSLTDRQRSVQAFSYELLIGNCRVCEADFYVVEASFMPTHPGADEYLHFNMPLDVEKNFVCSMDVADKHLPQVWLQQEYTTPIGIMRHNVFGPYKLLNKSSVMGQDGVNNCRANGGDDHSPWSAAKDLLLALWDDLSSPEIGCLPAALV